MFAGSPVWPGADEDATPPELSLVGPAMGVAAGTVGAAVGAGVMIAGGVWEKVRRGGGVGDVVGLVAGAVVGTMMVAVGVVGMEGGDGGLMGWSCARREVVHPLVDLGAVCDEMGGMVGLAWVVVGGEVLGLMGIIAGWVLVGSREVRGKEVF